MEFSSHRNFSWFENSIDHNIILLLLCTLCIWKHSGKRVGYARLGRCGAGVTFKTGAYVDIILVRSYSTIDTREKP